MTDFDELADSLVQVSAHISPSEVQGLLTGLLCGRERLGAEQTEFVVKQHFELESVPSLLSGVLSSLSAEVLQQLEAEDSIYELLLPDEYHGLLAQTDALGHWCQGFLVGFGTVTKKSSEQGFSEEVQSALKDVVEISNLEPPEEEDEEVAKAFFEIVEYLRVAAMVIFLELSGKQAASQSGSPVLH